MAKYGVHSISLLVLESWPLSSIYNNKIIALQWLSMQTRWGLNRGQRWHLCVVMTCHGQSQHTLSWITSLFHFSCHHITVCIYRSTKHTSHDIRHFSVWSCDTPTSPPGPSFLQLLLPMWKPWQRPVGTSLWHIAFILCEVWGRVQVLLWEKMEPRPQEPQSFQNGGRLPTTTQRLPVWLLSDHLLAQS